MTLPLPSLSSSPSSSSSSSPLVLVPACSTDGTVFIDLVNGPASYDDYADPVYEWKPPSVIESIEQLISSTSITDAVNVVNTRSFHTIVLSTSTSSGSSISQASTEIMSTLARFITSPACSSTLRTLRICGSLHILNDRFFQDALKNENVNITQLILQEPEAFNDSYSLAGLLASLNNGGGLEHLSLNIDQRIQASIHSSFNFETLETLRNLKSLALNLRGDVKDVIKSIFPADSMPKLEELSISIQASSWSEDITSTLKSALSDDNAAACLQSLVVRRHASDSLSIIQRPLDGTLMLPLLMLPNLSKLVIASTSPEEPILFQEDAFENLSQTLKTFELLHAGFADPVDMLISLRTILARLDNLQVVKVEQLYLPRSRSSSLPSPPAIPIMRNDNGEEEWELVSDTLPTTTTTTTTTSSSFASVAHPVAAAMNIVTDQKNRASNAMMLLAHDLGERGISFRLKLIGDTYHEERVSLHHA